MLYVQTAGQQQVFPRTPIPLFDFEELCMLYAVQEGGVVGRGA
jgi:hypothetical protein